jgi:putative ABC transport system permease protein
MTIREIWNRIAFWSRRAKLDRELSAELHAHIELLARDYESEGMSPDNALAAAHRRMGNVGQLHEAGRDYWGFPALEAIVKDIRYALRGLQRSPGFTATVILTLGLGIGANAAMFGAVDRLMFRPLAYLRDPSSVNRVYLQSTDRGRESTDWSFEYARYLDLRKWTSSFSQYAAFAQPDLAVGSGEDSREMQVAVVSAGFFDFFDAQPARGRWFTAAEDSTPRGAEVAVLSYSYWQSEYGGTDDVLGKKVQVGNILCTIIGVAPKGFSSVEDNTPAALFIPITTYAGSNANHRDATEYYTHYNWGWMGMMARRKPGVSVRAASADLSQAYVKSWAVEGTLGSVTPVETAHPHALASSLRTGAGPDPSLEAQTALWTIGVAAIVLLIACANVANLFLARAMRRRREIALRLALGSSRARLAAQSLTESLVLAVIGGVVGIVVAQWGGAALRSLFIQDGGPMPAFTDWRTLGFALGLATGAGVLTGLAPAILGGRGELSSTLKAGAREGTYHRSRMRTALLVAQGALSVQLLVGAGLFVKSLDHVRSLRIGYDADRVVLVDRHYRGLVLSDTAQLELGHRLESEARAIPGVEHASWVSAVPLMSTSSMGLRVDGIDSVRKLGRFTYAAVTPDYFSAMDTRILRGRGFNETDRDGSPLVAVVSQNMASVLWPGREALGQCMHVGLGGSVDTMPCTTVVGIAENVAQRGFTGDPQLHYYLAADQARRATGMALMIRVQGDPAKSAEVIRKRLQKLMPGQSYLTTLPMRDVVDLRRRSWKFGATVFVAFGGLALIVAAVGLYGVINYNVAQRTHELGVRIALGAQSRDVVRLVVGQGVAFASAGVAIGVALALLSAKWIQPLLFQEPARDPSTYAAVGVLLIGVGLAASAIPAFRATRADPNAALRSD